MKNIFPGAEEVIIEEIIAAKRISSKIPSDVECLESNYSENTTPIYNSKQNSVLPANTADYDIKLKIVNYFLSKKRDITVKETFELVKQDLDSRNLVFIDFLTIFNWLEESKHINYLVNMHIGMSDINNLKRSILNNEKETNNKTKSTENSPNTADKICAQSNHKYRTEKYIDPSKLLLTNCCKCENKANCFTSEFKFYCSNCTEGSSKRFHGITDNLINCMWSKKEEYYLLKAIETHKDNWELVEKVVNSPDNVSKTNEENVSEIIPTTKTFKTKEMCIFHFINMCILERLEEYNTLPFTKFQNQITPLIAFFSSVDCHISYKLVKKFFSIMHEGKSQTDVSKELLLTAIEECKLLINNKKEKIQRLNLVKIDAYLKRINLKIQSIEDTFNQVAKVKEELVEKREGLMEEIKLLR